MEVPYTVKPRLDTGLYNSKLGIWLFLASEVMLFGALFSSYILLRAAAPSWYAGPDVLNVPIGTLNTLILIISSVTILLSWTSIRLNDLKKYKLYMGARIFLGALFLFIKVYFEYLPKIDHGHIPSENNFYATYYTITGLHAIHIIGGLIVNLYFLGPGLKMYNKEPERFCNRIETAGLYWHFVDIVWIFLFPTIYLLPGS